MPSHRLFFFFFSDYLLSFLRCFNEINLAKKKVLIMETAITSIHKKKLQRIYLLFEYVLPQIVTREDGVSKR